MADVNFQSKEEILGSWIRALKIYTDLSDVSPGSNTATLLEAMSSSVYQIQLSALKILESTNLAALVGQQLDKKAESLDLPNGVGGIGRKPATQALGPVMVGSAFKKISSSLYAGKPAPYAGSTKIFLSDASAFPATGSIYIARGTTDRFEGPLPYSSVTNSGSFWVINLSTPLTKSHLLSDSVVLAQGGNRTVAAGTVVRIPASSQSPSVDFVTTQALTIYDGEDSGVVNVVCRQFGEVGNALLGSITAFGSIPFSGATVKNTTSFANGRSTESDEDLRLRIKNYPATLARGVKTAILSSILGLSDPSTGNAIQSAIVLDPIEPGDSARVYIDDGTGLEPTFGAQAYESLINSASGQERRFRTAQYPITPAVAEGSESAPFVVSSSDTLTVSVDGVVETYSITANNYNNLNAATAYEIVRDLNSQSNIVGFRTVADGTRVVMIDLSGTAEELVVQSSTLQSKLGFPTSTLRPIFVYKNSKLLSFKGKTAALETRPRSQWVMNQSDLQNVRVKVDGVIVEFSISNSDFAQFGTSVATATASQYVSVLSSKIPGVKFTASGDILVWSTRNILSATGSLEILTEKADNTPAGWVGSTKMWTPVADGGTLSAVGASKDMSFNRFSGEITTTAKLAAGDKLEIASRDTRAHIVSKIATTGLYSLGPSTSLGNSRMVLGFDGEFIIRSTTVSTGSTITPSQPDSVNAPNIIRLSANATGIFGNAQVGDWLYLVKDSSIVPTWGSSVEGFYRLKACGNQVAPVNTNYSALSASVATTPNVTVQTSQNSNQVRVLMTGHGFSGGDLITVSASNTIGGILAGNLSVSNVPVAVLDANTLQYTAGAQATSDDSGIINYISTNIVTVTQASHGFGNGSLITTTVGTGFGGISSGNLSITSPIEFVDANTYRYRAAAAATSVANGTINTVSYLADCWVEFEVSSTQLTDWLAILSAQSANSNMINLFKSTAQPQLVDFGASATQTVEQVVAAINSQVASGSAVKITPTEFSIRSNDFESGTCAVLATVGNALNLFDKATSTSLQYHIGYAHSGEASSGFVVVDSVVTPTAPTSGHPTRTYLNVDKKLVDVLDTNSNPTINSPAAFTPTYPEGFEHLWLTGRPQGLVERVYNNQNSAPYTGVMTGTDVIKALGTSDTYQTSTNTLDRYANYGLRLRDLNISATDKFVAEMDLNPTDKTVAINLAKRALIQDIDAIAGAGKGQVLSFRLMDPDDSNKPFFDNTSVYKSFNFADFKLLTKSVGLYRLDASSRALILRSASVGGQHRLRLQIKYANQSGQTIAISHYNNHSDAVNLNLIVNLGSGPVISGSQISSGSYKVVSSASGNIYSMRLTSGSVNAGGQYQPGNVINISGNSPLVGSYQIDSTGYYSANTLTASVTTSSNTVTVTAPSHGLQNGDLISVSAGAAIGGIAAPQLSQSDTPITYINANSFSYSASAAATSSASGTLSQVTSGLVVFKTPGDGGISTGLFSGSAATVSSWTTTNTTYIDIANAINSYYPSFPVATAVAIGTSLATTYISTPTYITYAAAPAYTASDMGGAFDQQSFSCKWSGEAGIWQYDSSNSALNNIKATVQSDDSIFPTILESAGTSYSPISEEVYLVPTNTKTLSAWFNFNAASSLNLLAAVERIQSDSVLQISSLSDGSAGAVKVTGVTSNAASASVEANGTDTYNSSKVSILSAEAKSLAKNSAVLLQNSISTEIQRPYRTAPSGSSITTSNTTDISTYFRKSNGIKYIKTGANTGRILFLRDGMGPSQSEHLSAGNTIQFTNLSNDLVQITSALAAGSPSTGKMAARVGDMMYIRPDTTSPFSSDQVCRSIISTGQTDGENPTYIGYPVVHVIDDHNILILAPNISTFNTVTLAGSTADTDVVFLPAIWNEKNIRTTHAEGPHFDQLINSGNAYYLVKSLGSGLVSVWLQNSSSESTDTMKLQNMSVSTDDWAVFSDQFAPSNRGTYKVVAHNGRNHLVIYNPNGGSDEIINASEKANGGTGDRKWRVGPISGSERPVRILSGESVRLGDKLRISTPASPVTQWFNDTFIGSWEITGIGLSAFNFTGSLPHSYSVGSFDLSKICPYVDINIPSAPVSITDSNNAAVDSFLMNLNNTSIGFVEGTPYFGIRMVAGVAVSPDAPDVGEVFLVPQIKTQAMSDVFGTTVSALNKIGFESKTHLGIDGYKVFTGLVQQAHRTIDGLQTNTTLYPGVKAAGTSVEVLPPLIKTIDVSLLVYPKDGVTLNSITDLVKSSVASYVNGLGVGKSVILSEIVKTVQLLPGVLSVQILSTTPEAYQDRITASETEKAVILNASTDVTVG